jgi:hypothetical protein
MPMVRFAMSVPVDQHRFVFVGGLPRSGTTIMATFIGQFEDASEIQGTKLGRRMADEGQYVQNVYPTQKAAGGIAKFGYSPEMHITEASPLVTEASRDELWNAWSPHWDTSQTVLVEKTPSNLLKMRFLQALFPNASFIVLVRHPVAEAMAIRSRNWTRVSVHDLVDHWLAAHDTMATDLASLDRVIVIRYEDLVTNPNQMLKGIQNFLGLEGNVADEDLRPGLNESYFDEWKKGGPLTALRNRRTVSRYESRINELGYSFSSPMPVGPLPENFPTL